MAAAGFIRDDSQRTKRSDVTIAVAASLQTYVSPALGVEIRDVLQASGWRCHRVSGTWFWRARREAIADRLPAPPAFATERRKKLAKRAERNGG